MTTDLYSLIEQLTAWLFIQWGFVILINKNILKKYLGLFSSEDEKHEMMSYIMAALFVVLGGLIILTHNDWIFGPSVVVTAMGWILAVKYTLWLAIPKIMRKIVIKFKPVIMSSWFSPAIGCASIALGAITLWGIWRGAVS